MDFPTDSQGSFFEDDASESFSQNPLERSFTASTVDFEPPFTPVSGRSTPNFYSIPIEQSYPDYSQENDYYGFTSDSGFSVYPEDKLDPTLYSGFQFPKPLVPTDNDRTGTTDSRGRHPLPTPILQSANPRSFEEYPPDEKPIPITTHLPSGQYNFDRPPYSLDSFVWPVDGALQLIGSQDPPPDVLHLNNAQYPSSPALTPYQWWPPRANEVQQKSIALQKVQRRRVNRKAQRPKPAQKYDERGHPIIEKGRHVCPRPECGGLRRFKRREHLKRHEESTHGSIRYRCPFCPKTRIPINRLDNFATHLELHTRKDGTGKVPYHPGAQIELDRINQGRKLRKKTIEIACGEPAVPPLITRQLPLPV